MSTCFLCLQIKNPKWKPTDQGAQFISTIKENGECEMVKYCSMFSLCRRRSQTPVSNVCKVAPISLFWAANGLNNLPEMRFRFPSTSWANRQWLFEKSNHGTYSNRDTQVAAQNKDFVADLQTLLIGV